MDRATSSRSSNAVAPAPASPLESGQFQSVFKPDAFETGDFHDDNSRGLSSTTWGLKYLQWILALLATGMLVATSYASQRIYDMGETFKDIMSSLNLNPNSLDVVDRTVQLTLLVSWLLAGGAIIASAISIIWKFWNAAKRERFKHLAKDGEIDSRTAWMCFRFNALRALLTTVHVFCILACIWFVLMLCALVALLVLLFVGQKTAGGALTFIQTAETNANKFAADIFVRIEEYEKDLEELTATITVYCALLGCPEVIDDTQERMTALSAEMGGLLAAVEEAEVCPSASCINLDLFWFLEAKGCICASDTIQVVSSLGESAQRDCRNAVIAVAVAYLCALLMLSKTAMNLNNHVNDDHWMRRVRRIFMKLQDKGIRFPANEAESGTLLGAAPSVASLNEFYNAVFPPKPQGMAASQRAPSLPGSPTRSPVTPHHKQSSHRLKNRHYFGIEPPVSLGSDYGGSGPLPASGSKRLSRGPGDGGFGGALSSGSLAPAPSGLAREHSAASVASGTARHSRRRSEGDGGAVGVGIGINRGRRGLGNGMDAAVSYADGENESPPARGQGNGGFLGAVQSMCFCIAAQDAHDRADTLHNDDSVRGRRSGDADSLGRGSGVLLPIPVSAGDLPHADELPAPMLPGLLRSRSGKRLGFGSGGSGRMEVANSTGGMERGDQGDAMGVFADSGLDDTTRSGGPSGGLATPTAGGNVELSIIHEARESDASLQSQHDRRASLVSMPEDLERENSSAMESKVAKATSGSLSNTDTLRSKSLSHPETAQAVTVDSTTNTRQQEIQEATGSAVAEGACVSHAKPGPEGGSSEPDSASKPAGVTARTIVREASLSVFAGSGERSQSDRALLKRKPAPNARRSSSGGLSALGGGDAGSSGASTPTRAPQSSIGANSSIDLRVPSRTASGRVAASSMRSMPSFGSWNFRNSFTMPWFGRNSGSRRYMEGATHGGNSLDEFQFAPVHAEGDEAGSAEIVAHSPNSHTGNAPRGSQGPGEVADSGQDLGNPMEQIERLETEVEHDRFEDAPEQASATAEGVHTDYSTNALRFPESLEKHVMDGGIGPEDLHTLGFISGAESTLQEHSLGSKPYNGDALAPLQPCAMMPASQLSWGAAEGLGNYTALNDSPCTASIVPGPTAHPLPSPSRSGSSPKGSTGELNLPFLLPVHGETPATPVATSDAIMHTGSPIAESLVDSDDCGDTVAEDNEGTVQHRFAVPMSGFRRHMMHEIAATPIAATGTTPQHNASHEGLNSARSPRTPGYETRSSHREEMVTVEDPPMVFLQTPNLGVVPMEVATGSTHAGGDQLTPELMLEAARRRSQTSGLLPAPSVWGPSGVSASLPQPDPERSNLLLQRSDTQGTSALFYADREDSCTSDAL